MSVIVNSKHKAFCDYIMALLSAENDKIQLISPTGDCFDNHTTHTANLTRTTDHCFERAIHPDTVIILDAHSKKLYSKCSAIDLLDKLLEMKLNNPVIILGWLKKDDLKALATADISCYFNDFYKDLYVYLQLPVTKESLLSCLQSIKPLNQGKIDFYLQMRDILKQYNTYVRSRQAHKDKVSFGDDIALMIRILEKCDEYISNKENVKSDDVESIKMCWNRIHKFLSLIVNYKGFIEPYPSRLEKIRETMNIGKNVVHSLENKPQEVDNIQSLIDSLPEIDKILGEGSIFLKL